MMNEKWYGGASRPRSASTLCELVWPVSKHSISGLMPCSCIALANATMSSKPFANTKLNAN